MAQGVPAVCKEMKKKMVIIGEILIGPDCSKVEQSPKRKSEEETYVDVLFPDSLPCATTSVSNESPVVCFSFIHMHMWYWFQEDGPAAYFFALIDKITDLAK